MKEPFYICLCVKGTIMILCSYKFQTQQHENEKRTCLATA